MFDKPEYGFKEIPIIDACSSKNDIKCGPFGTQLKQSEYTESGVAIWGIPQINSEFSIKPDAYVTAEKAIQLESYSLISGDIAMSRKGNVGQCAIYPEGFLPGIIASDVLRIRIDQTRLLPRFMQYQLHHSDQVRQQILKVSNGAVMAGINVTKLKAIKVFIPPMELQETFVELVKQSDKSKFTGFKSQFIEMFGDPVDNPMGWPLRKLSDVVKVDGTMTKEYEKYADYPHIGIDSIEKNTGILSGYRTVQEDNVISPKYYFGPQHILYSKIRPALNKVALPDFEGLCSADCYPLLVTGMCDRKFLAHVMRSDYFLDYVLSYSGRSQMPKVNRKQLEGFSFPCPPIELQEKFTVLIDQSDKSK